MSSTDRKLLHDLVNGTLAVSEVVHGGCSGVDTDAGYWAKSRGIPVKVLKADWQKHGKSAGPIRNRQMAEYADALIAFPGGRGTASMIREATKRGLVIYDLSAS